MQIYETSFGNGQSLDYETCRFVYTLWNVVWPCLKYGIWRLNLCCWSPLDTVYYNKTIFGSCQGWNMQSRRCTHMCCTSMKHGLALVELWIMKSYVLCWSLFDAAHHHKPPFGSCQGRHMQTLRLTQICCTSMKRSLALVKLWIMKSDCFLLVFVRYLVSS